MIVGRAGSARSVAWAVSAAALLLAPYLPTAGAVPFGGRAQVAAGSPPGPHALAYLEPPVLAERVQAGEFPPVAERLPRRPHVTRLEAMGREPGRHGGRLRMLMSRAKDVRLMVVYGYARLVGYDENLALVPDLLERVEVEEERVFTLHLRPGHRWSDGHPFTAEDFRYWWEDVANHDELSPSGPPRELLAGGQPPRFEVLDETTVRYSWDSPNPFFLPALAGARPTYIYAPSHWLRRFHARYADPERLDREARDRGRRSWASIHNRRDSPYRNLDIEAPTLQPWRNVTPSPAQRYVFRRNPFFHRVDGAGRQLPYVDEVVMTVTDTKLIPAKTGAGESDLQVRGLGFDDFTFLKRSEERIGRRVRLWKTTKGSHVALYPNLNVERSRLAPGAPRRALPARPLARDRSARDQPHPVPRIRHSRAATPSTRARRSSGRSCANDGRSSTSRAPTPFSTRRVSPGATPRPGSGGFRTAGLAVIVVETAGETSEQADILELVHDTWLKAGVKLYTKPLQRETFRNRVFAGETLMSVWGGLENGTPGPATSPAELAPTSQQQLQWPKWGQHFQNRGRTGEPVRWPVRDRAARAVRGMDRGARAGEASRDLAPNARHPRGPGLLDRHRGRDPAAGGGERAATKRARARGLQLGAGRPPRHPPDGHLLVRTGGRLVSCHSSNVGYIRFGIRRSGWSKAQPDRPGGACIQAAVGATGRSPLPDIGRVTRHW